MEARDYLDILRRRWLSVLIVALTALAAASLLTLAIPKKYTATTSLFFAVAGSSVSDLAQGSDFAAQQMSSYAKVATSPLVLEPVIQQLALPTTAAELEKSVEATVPPETVTLEIAVTDADPRRAATIANAIFRMRGSPLSRGAPIGRQEPRTCHRRRQARAVGPGVDAHRASPFRIR